MAKEIVNIKKTSALNREKKKLFEKEEVLKRIKYNMEKAQKEEEEIEEQKQIWATREGKPKNSEMGWIEGKEGIWGGWKENELKRLVKQKRLEEQAFDGQKEYEYIIKYQITVIEEERRLEEIKKEKFNING